MTYGDGSSSINVCKHEHGFKIRSKEIGGHTQPKTFWSCFNFLGHNNTWSAPSSTVVSYARSPTTPPLPQPWSDHRHWVLRHSCPSSVSNQSTLLTLLPSFRMLLPGREQDFLPHLHCLASTPWKQTAESQRKKSKVASFEYILPWTLVNKYMF